MLIYTTHSRKKTSNALNTLVLPVTVLMQRPPDPTCPRAKSSRQSGQQRQMPDVHRFMSTDDRRRCCYFSNKF